MSADAPIAREMDEGEMQIPNTFEEPVDLKAFELLDDIYNMVGLRYDHHATDIMNRARCDVRYAIAISETERTCRLMTIPHMAWMPLKSELYATCHHSRVGNCIHEKSSCCRFCNGIRPCKMIIFV